MRILLVILLLLAGGAAFAQFKNTSCAVGMPGFCNNEGSGSGPVLSNLRITNTGDFRVINSGDNRAVFP